MAELHTGRAHAKLGPSSAHRWIMCPGSIRMSEGIPSTTSTYAAEGTAAHELASIILQTNHESADEFIGQRVHIADDTIHHVVQEIGVPNGIDIFLIDEEMADAVNTYVEFVRGLIAEVEDNVAIVDVEQRLDMRHIHPAIFGTGDAVVYNPTTGHLHVVDFKYGKGKVVSVEENPQLFLYGSGALRRYHNQQVRRLTLHIVQPRAAGQAIKSWDTDVLELLDFEGDIAKWARATEAPDAPLKAGDWCGFCPAKATCPTHRADVIGSSSAEFDDVTGEITMPPIASLTAEQRGNILRGADRLMGWVKSVQEFEHGNALAGNPPAGFKLVAKRAVRKWRDTEQAVAACKAVLGAGSGLLFTEPEFKSPAQVEKVLGKQQFAATAAGFVVQQSSGVNLVPVEDPRPAVVVGAEAEFAAVDMEN